MVKHPPNKAELEPVTGLLFFLSTKGSKIYLANWLEDAHREIINYGFERWKAEQTKLQDFRFLSRRNGRWFKLNNYKCLPVFGKNKLKTTRRKCRIRGFTHGHHRKMFYSLCQCLRGFGDYFKLYFSLAWLTQYKNYTAVN